jgi:hypothetical protein
MTDRLGANIILKHNTCFTIGVRRDAKHLMGFEINDVKYSHLCRLGEWVLLEGGLRGPGEEGEVWSDIYIRFSLGGLPAVKIYFPSWGMFLVSAIAFTCFHVTI